MSRSPFDARFTARRQSLLLERAAHMRHAPTASEALLFSALRAGRLGFTVRRQVPLLGRFIADLFVPAVRLVIEVDGAYHQDRAVADATRDRVLLREGYTVLRLDAQLVTVNLLAAVERVTGAVALLRAARG